MEHNSGLTEEQDVDQYIKRDLLISSKKSPPYKIIRDEIVGRYIYKYIKLINFRFWSI
jgi:hypothetical protein